MPTESPFRFGLIILAAGASTRMARPKPLLDIAGQPLVVRVATAALASAAWPVVVVLGSHASLIRPVLARYPLLVVDNPGWSEGLASSVRVGLETLDQFSRQLEAGLITLADQPGLTPQAIARLVDAHLVSGRRIAAARYAGRLGVPALFPRAAFPALAALQGDAGARHLLARNADEVVGVDLPELALDLDTPADYAAYTGGLARSRREPPVGCV